LGFNVTNGALKSLHHGWRHLKGGEGSGRKTASAFGTILGRRQRSSVGPDTDARRGVGACLAEVNEERKSTHRQKEGDTMHRRTCIHLTVLAATMALVAGTIQPARAQDEKTPAFAQVLPADGKVLVTWAAVKDATGYTVSRRNVGDDISKAVVVNAQPIKETSLAVDGLTNGTPILFSVQAIFADGSKGDPKEAVGTPQTPILGKFQFYTLETTNPGSVSVDNNNVLTIHSAGADIWDTADGQTFLATPVSGDFTLTAKVLGAPTGGEPTYGKVGVQAKYSITPGDPYALVFASVARDPEFMFEGRRQAGGGDNFSGPSAGGDIPDPDNAKFPVWLRLTRKGNVLSSSYSNDGKTFSPVFDDQTFDNAPQTMYVGIAATSHDDATYLDGKIDATSITITTP
jgi:regulation of enolase protein 1 (concanavalin A-like superfamily)